VDVRDAEGGSTVRVRVSPRASRDGLGGFRAGALVVRVTAPPIDGQANAAVARLVARVLGVPAGAVELLRGAKGRDKLLRVTGLSADAVRARLQAAA
jgi:uncharacterized protein (TIGR00251 family)